jgi:hypothetical protein
MAYIGAGITRFNTADELTVTGTSEFGGNVSFGDNNITNVGSLQIDSIAGDADTNTNITFAGSDVITMTTAGSERLRLDASGNVGIGTSSPDHNLTLSANSNPIFEMVQVAGGPYKHQIAVGGNDLQLRASSGALIMYTGNADGASSTERMRIDHSGNLLVGKTSNDSTTVGANIRADKSFFTSSGQEALVLNRNTSDGTILELRKANGTVGSIGTSSSRLHIENGDTGLRIAGDLDQIFPCGSGGGDRDAAIDLGSTGVRFKDIYLSGGAYLGGTGSANKLDDYEEGSISGLGVETGTASFSKARYTKIGNLVNVKFSVNTFSDRTSANSVKVTGLPFTSVASHGDTVGSVLGRYVTAGDSGNVMANIGSSATTLFFYGTNDGGNWDSVSHSELNNSSAQFYVNITYETA